MYIMFIQYPFKENFLIIIINFKLTEEHVRFDRRLQQCPRIAKISLFIS
jgi:hypothetical protein